MVATVIAVEGLEKYGNLLLLKKIKDLEWELKR